MITLTPERSIAIQNSIGADIIMQLDDVVASTTTGPRVEEAMHRTVRWLDRCVEAHEKPNEQSVYPIVQGGLDPDLRRRCALDLVKRDCPGYAIGGLSGGEEKDCFWRMVKLSCDVLPPCKPRYVMGVGYAVDLLACAALGADMFDCVFPTRTARFGTALIHRYPGLLHLQKPAMADDFTPIDAECTCPICSLSSDVRCTRAYLRLLRSIRSSNAGRLLSLHNLHFQRQLMCDARLAILEHRFPQFLADYMFTYFAGCGSYPTWLVNALHSVHIELRPLST